MCVPWLLPSPARDAFLAGAWPVVPALRALATAKRPRLCPEPESRAVDQAPSPALKQTYSSLAFGSISTGEFKFCVHRAAQIAVDVALAFLSEHKRRKDLRLYLVEGNAHVAAPLRRAVARKARRGHDDQRLVLVDTPIGVSTVSVAVNVETKCRVMG